ncbi:MAG: ClbS/DfsB family four-helix bundle protein, partial [Anaerolineales bacterium]|nr:ClbS/DfsB family four-helix bundle protein [Anaerolineales bacterium]
LVKLLWQASQGQTPTTIHFTDATDDETNLAWSRLGESRPLEQVWQDFHAVRRQTIQRVRALADKDFGDPARFPWLDGRPLEDWIAADTHGHEAEHTAQIRAWRKNLV